jgi:hypothetical protein
MSGLRWRSCCSASVRPPARPRSSVRLRPVKDSKRSARASRQMDRQSSSAPGFDNGEVCCEGQANDQPQSRPPAVFVRKLKNSPLAARHSARRASGCAGPGVAMQVRDKAAQSAAYRPDIDGLRAIAVVAVVMVHAGSRIIFAGVWTIEDASLLEATIEHSGKFVPGVIVLGRAFRLMTCRCRP